MHLFNPTNKEPSVGHPPPPPPPPTLLIMIVCTPGAPVWTVPVQGDGPDDGDGDGDGDDAFPAGPE